MSTEHVVLLVGLLQFLASAVVTTRLTNSVKYEYDTKLEKMKLDYATQLESFRLGQRNREKVTLVAELLAEYMDQKTRDMKRFNRLAYECAMWLPASLQKKLAERLRLPPGSDRMFELLNSFRNHLLGPDEGQGLDRGDLVHLEPTQP